MPTYDYRRLSGDRVPGVTTVLGNRKQAGGLIHWAWDLGKQGLDYRKVRDDAADAGTLAHLMVECDIRGRSMPGEDGYPPETYKKARNAFEAYLEWVKQSNLMPAETELSLVSEVYGFGGTLDAMLIGDKLCLGDWKTSNGIYVEYLAQLAAYGQLWSEHYPSRPIHGYHLIRFSKGDDCDFSHHYWSDLEDAWKLFYHLLQCYELDKVLKRRV